MLSRSELRTPRPYMPQERNSVRLTTFLKARIRIQSWRTVDCIVRNVSLSGARLEVSPTYTLPSEFELEIPQRGAAFKCALKWRKDDAVGVKFLDSMAPTAQPPASEIEDLRSENSQLRDEVARLTARVQELMGEEGQSPQSIIPVFLASRSAKVRAAPTSIIAGT
jgi:hypothetical protein